METDDYKESDLKEEKVTPRQFRDAGTGRFPERLKEAMGGRSLRGFAKNAHLSEGVIRNYLRGETYPTLDRLDALAAAAEVDVAWLATGASRGPFDESQVTDKSSPHRIDEDLLRNLIGRLEELIEDAGEEWSASAKAHLIARAYREEKDDEDLPDNVRNMMRLVKSA